MPLSKALPPPQLLPGVLMNGGACCSKPMFHIKISISILIMLLQNGQELSSEPGQCIWWELHVLLEGFLCLGLPNRKPRGCREQRSCHCQQHQGQRHAWPTHCCLNGLYIFSYTYIDCIASFTVQASACLFPCCISALVSLFMHRTHQTLWLSAFYPQTHQYNVFCTGSHCRRAGKKEGHQSVGVLVICFLFFMFSLHVLDY